MNRHVVAGMLGLALAGCSLNPRSRSTLAAVELTPPLATIHETINQENARVDTDTVRAGHPVAARGQAAPAQVAAARPVTGTPAPPVTDPAAAATAPKPAPAETETTTAAAAATAPKPAPAETETTTAAAAATAPKPAPETTTAAAPTEPAPQPPAAPAAPTAPRVAQGRPAPFARFLGRPRPREVAAAVVATTPAPPAAQAGKPVYGTAGPALSPPDPEMTAPLPPEPPAAPPAAVAAPPAQGPPPAGPTSPAPRPDAAAPPSPPVETPPDGHVKAEGPAAPGAGAPVSEPAPAPKVETPAPAAADSPAPEAVTPKPAGRDPLLGANPDIMPDLSVPAAPAPEPGKAKGPDPATPAPAPDLPPASVPPPAAPDEPKAPAADTSPLSEPVGSGDVKAAPSPAPVIHLSPPTELESTPANAEPPATAPAPTVSTPAAAPAAPAAAVPPPSLPEAAPAPVPPTDPTPAPNPVAEPKPETPAAAHGVPIPTGGGKPPSVSEITGITQPEAAAPVPSDPATTPARAEVPASPPADAPAPIPPAAATPPPAVVPDAHPVGAAPAPIPPAAAPSARIEIGRPEPAPAAAVEARTSAPALPDPGRDPLLGPDPDIMPSIALPPAKGAEPAPPAQAAPAPAPDPRPAPAPAQAPAPVPAPAPAPAPTRTSEAGPKSAENVADPVELPPLSNPQAATAVGSPRADGFASVPVSGPTRDPEVQQAAGGAGAVRPPLRMPEDATAVRSSATPRAVFEAGKPAAWVGDEVITIHELTVVFKQRRKGMAAGQELSPEMRYYMARTVLNDMVDRALVIQEAKRDLKDAKKFQKFMEVADAQFYDEEVPPLLRQTGTKDAQELKTKMAASGESLDEVREQFRLEFLSRGYMEQKLGPKMKVDLREMREFYKAHLHDFDLPAQVTWREVLVEVEKYKSRAEAKAKADAVLARLRKGDDFAAVAKAESDGPNRADGGLWKTSPGSYGVPAVNAALESLPTGQASPVIEGPTSYHIVLVENRRAAGPATFAEVQDKCHNAIRRQKINKETTAYLDKLRRRTVVRTVFDDPGVTRTSAETVSPARP